MFSYREECEAQILNFSGAKYKKFLNAEDAELWVNQIADALPATRVQTAGVVHEPTSPAARGSGRMSSAAQVSKSKSASVTTTSPIQNAGYLVSRPASSFSSAPVTLAMESLTHPATHPDVVKSQTTVSTEPLVIYTDGSSKGNGKRNALAGVGVWYGHDDPRYVPILRVD